MQTLAFSKNPSLSNPSISKWCVGRVWANEETLEDYYRTIASLNKYSNIQSFDYFILFGLLINFFSFFKTGEASHKLSFSSSVRISIK